MSARKPSRSKRPTTRRARSKLAHAVALTGRPPVTRWRLTGSRTATHANLRNVIERTGSPVAWGRPGAGALVVLTAEHFAELTGRGVPLTTFAPSRFCPRCDRFTGGRTCLHCDPPTARATRST